MTFLLKILVSIGLLFIAFKMVPDTNFKGVFDSTDPNFLVLAALFYGCSYIVGGIRWKKICDFYSIKINAQKAISIFFSAGFFSQFLVGGGYGGDFYRVWAVSKSPGSVSAAIGSVLVDRFSGLLTAALTSILITPLLAIWYRDYFYELWFLGVTISLALISVILITRPGFAEYMGNWKVIQRKWPQKLFRLLGSVVEGFSNPSFAVGHMSWSFLGLLFNAAALVCIAAAFDLRSGLIPVLVMTPLIFIFKAMPFSFAGWGSREVAAVYFLGLAGVEASFAITVSVVAGLLTFLSSTPGLLFWMATKNQALSAQGRLD